MAALPDLPAAVAAPVSLTLAARRLGLLAVTVRACIKGAILSAVETGTGEYYIAEDELRRFASAVGITLAPAAHHTGGQAYSH